MRAITLISGQALHDAQMRLPIRSSSSSSHGIRIDRPFFQPVFRVKPPVLPALNTQFTACTVSTCGDHDLCPFHTARPDATKSYCRVAWRWHRRCEGVPTVPIIADRKLETELVVRWISAPCKIQWTPQTPCDESDPAADCSGCKQASKSFIKRH